MSSAAFEDFIDRVRRITALEDAAGMLRWDQEVMMPEGGTPPRAKQLSTLSAVRHDLLTDTEMETWIEELSAANLDGRQAAILREVQREHDRAMAVPRDLIEELSERTSEAHPAWREARENDDFERFAPVLEELLALKQEYARHIDASRDPYAVLVEEFEPYIDLETIDRILTHLRNALVPLIDAVRQSDVDLSTPFVGTFAVDRQEAALRAILDDLGYDWTRGRLDTSPHPFTAGTYADARITTRFDHADLLGAITSTVHEFGHAQYLHGLPDEGYGTPLGQPRDLSVHESQSRFWENHIARSEAFWERALPQLREQFPTLRGVTPQAAYEAANRVDPTTVIRVNADELTYHLHIVVRYEIERALVNGELDVEEVPAVWNDKYEEYLGIRPTSDSEGALQDIHWSHGHFGYFPTYSLGSVIAAQLNETIRTERAVDDRVRDGAFDTITEWLGKRVHRYGCRYRTDELVERATGRPPSSDAFVAYVREKYGTLYDLPGGGA